MSNVVQLVTEEQKILSKFKPLKLEDFNLVEGFTEEDIRQLNRATVIEQLSSLLVQEYIGESREIRIERFFDFQSKAFEAASGLLEAC